jgi:hypothetical protein
MALRGDLERLEPDQPKKYCKKVANLKAKGVSSKQLFPFPAPLTPAKEYFVLGWTGTSLRIEIFKTLSAANRWGF